MRLGKTLAVTAFGTVLALGGALAPAQAAPAAPSDVTCGNAYWPHTNKDDGSGTVDVDRAAVHTGPYGACRTTGYLYRGDEVTYDCYVVNDYGNTWSWVRDLGGNSIGWVWDSYLDNGGAWERC